ncbi:MAG: response regulator transcription factor [Gammaproteobacteria bacterium]|uniref:response regulator n=1 Tax=Limnobacter sp. TaxID=2003368 RepID=UPI001DB15BC7|nr:response regulator transcription factor [Limnobacter sp.]MBU0784152.1 response regulator transcription factor [Gammaproteobacteria bacterium]MBU0848245.1 response regulator transcription factor [Gammaproteobacteria bacterium]MBU1266939.1 response regulator transcription factor [Gammaproteobacteria bacterium]MBU1528452.1 response regulator transcription factor [Gammaproteobacteria bacterium]MBU1779141.1 response regulator transcription factor [Gammaproteobacteria bacterium]
MIKVLLADDHALLRGSLKQLLEDTNFVQVVAQAGDYSEIMKAMGTHSVDLAILDISMPGKNGVDIVKILKDKYPALKILMLSMHPEDQYAVRCLKAGASGYLTKNTAPEKLVDAIQVIAAGRKYITPELAESLASHLTEDSEKPLHASLSDREFQTIRMIASGKKLSEIADELSLSPKTVSVYRARILEKMRMKTNGELTRYALENGLI